MFATIVITILAIIASLIVDFIIAQEFYRIAVFKGFKYDRYFWFPFIFPIIGYLMVLALPDRGTASDTMGNSDNHNYGDTPPRTISYEEKIKARRRNNLTKSIFSGVVIIMILVTVFILSNK